jgi:hypothetical protein
MRLWILALPGLALLSDPASAADVVEPRVARDLLTVITMEGLPCGEVVGAQRRTDEDYTVTCKTGDRYRVRILDERVKVERLEASRAGESPQG